MMTEVATFIYVISDLHGEYDLFLKLLQEISFDKTNDKLYILGDVIDRGSQSIEILQHVYNNQDSIVLLKGNHEEMMVDCLLNHDYYMWFYNGGGSTYQQYSQLPENTQIKLFYFVKGLPYLLRIEVEDRVFILAHAGVEADENGQIYVNQDIEYLLWARDEFLYDTDIVNDMTVIVGHTPTPMILGHKKDTIWHSRCGKKICIDCGSVFTGVLACLRLDDMREFYVKKNRKG